MESYLSDPAGAAIAFSALLAPCLLAGFILYAVLRGAPPMTDDLSRLHAKEPRMNLLTKSRLGLNLTPGERAVLKLLQGLLVAAGVAALPVVADALSSHGVVDWAATLHNAILLGVAASATALVKYFKAQGDSPLLSAVEGVLTNAAAQLTADAGLNEPVVEPDPPTTPPTPPSAPAANALPQAA